MIYDVDHLSAINPVKLGHLLLDNEVLSDPEKVELIAKLSPAIVTQHETDHTPLHLAAILGNADSVRILVEYLICVNHRSEDLGATALHYAAIMGHEGVARILLGHGADIDILDDDGFTALFYAVKNGYTNLCQLLLEHGATIGISRRRYDGASEMHLAAKLKHADIIRLLIEYGAQVDAKDENGNVPFNRALFSGNIEACHLLIDAGADLSGIHLKHLYTLNKITMMIDHTSRHLFSLQKFWDIIYLLIFFCFNNDH